MPRRPRICPVGYPVHVIQRGNNRNICFTCDADITDYASRLQEAATQYNVLIHGWVFMTNHVHLLLTPQKENAISRMMQVIGRSYVRSFNTKYGRSGTLFEGRFKSSVVQEDVYLLACLQYIELNPMRAGMVTDPGDYRWSSYAAHALGKHISMLTPHPSYIAIHHDTQTRQKIYRAKIEEVLKTDVFSNIRHCENHGLILGTEKFKQQFEHLTGDTPQLEPYSGTLL